MAKQNPNLSKLSFYKNDPSSYQRPNSTFVCNEPEYLGENIATNKGIYIRFPNESMVRNGVANAPDDFFNLPVFDFNRIAEGFYGTVQNALVETLTNKGSDTSHPDRGTTLQEEAVSAFITNNTDLIHSCNFASNDVKLNQNNDLLSNYKETAQVEVVDDVETIIYTPTDELVSPGIQEYKLSPEAYVLDSCKLQAYFKSTDGEEFGINLNTNII